MRRLLITAIALLAAVAVHAAAPTPAGGDDATLHPGGGLYLRMPDKWVVQPAAPEEPAPPSGAKPAAQHKPLVVVGKYGASHPGFNPKIRVFYQPIPPGLQQSTPLDLLRLVLQAAQVASPDMKLEHEVRETTVAELPAADVSWLYTLPGKDGTPLPVRARTVLVRQGDHFFTIGMSAPREGPDDVRPEFQRFLDTMKIAEKPTGP